MGKDSKIESKHISYENDSVFLPTGGAIDTNKLKNKLAKNINFIKSKNKITKRFKRRFNIYMYRSKKQIK